MDQHSNEPPTRLTKDAVQVWRADLDALPDELKELCSPAERTRGAKMVKERDGVRWMRARGALRALLGGYLGGDPRALDLQTGPHGKPALGEAEGRLSFNLSHSRGLALYAFTSGAPVGVDIEVVDLSSRRNDIAVAASALGAATAERLATLDPATRRREFLREWVRHEAALKCRGIGIWGSVGSGARAKTRTAPVGEERENKGAPPNPAKEEHQQDSKDPELWITELELGPSAAAATAVQGTPGVLRLWTYPAQAPIPL